MNEYPIAISERIDGVHGHWVMVVGKVLKVDESWPDSRSKMVQEGESLLVTIMGWPHNFSWRILIVLTIVVTIVVTFLMLLQSSSLWALVIVQQVCTIFFVVDFFIAVMHRTMYFSERIYSYRRQNKWLVIEAVSLLPLTIIYLLTFENADRTVAFWLSSNLLLRFYRVPQFFSDQAQSAGVPHLRLTILKYTLYIFLSLFIFSTLWMRTTERTWIDHIKDVDRNEKYEFYVALYFSFMTFTNTGFGDIYAVSIHEKFLCIGGMLIGFALTSGILVGAITTHLLCDEKQREQYRREYDTTINKLKSLEMDKKRELKILGDFNMLWKYKRGVTNIETFNLFPIPLRKEIFFDITFGLLNRSPIFSIQERFFLRSVSLSMKNKTYLPGDDIIGPRGIFRGMICVAAGVIEILSRENEDSPLISFTSGTILGEVSLFMAMPINTIIRAATFVELQVLDTIEFYRLALNFPSICSSMREVIIQRYRESLKINLSTAMNTLDPEEESFSRFKVLKSLIEELKQRNVDEEPGTSLEFFKTNILNLYVLIENIPRVKTLPFTLVRNKPWILRPDTSFIFVWEIFMFVVVTVVLYSYPYLAAFVRRIDNTIFTFLLFVQIAYMVDVLLQCMTAIPRRDLVSYKVTVKEIVLTRLKSYGFYLDVLSTYDFGVFSSLFVFGNYDYTRLLLSQNKLLRVWMIPRFFKKFEEELSTNLLFFRLLKYIYYTTLLIHFGSAMVYLEACPGTICHPDRWFSHHQELEVLQNDTLPYTTYPYLLSLYLALMATSTTGFGNVQPSSLDDIYVLIALMILGLVVFNYCLAEMSITFKHRERKRTEFQEEVFAIDRFLVEHNLPRNLRQRVRKYFEAQWKYDRGSLIKRDIPLEQLPKKQKNIMIRERLTTLQAVPIFKDANRGFMTVLAKGCQVRLLPENEVVVYPGGLDKEMYIIQNGYCRITEKQNPSESFIIGPLASFGDLEMVQGLPFSIHVKTVTHAIIICIEYSTYLRAVTKYPNVRRDIESLMETHKPRGQTSFDIVSYERTAADHKMESRKWFRRIGESVRNSVINVYRYEVKNGRNYWKPFEAWKKFHFLKYIFLPYVLKPDSPVLVFWIATRILSSILMGLFAPVYFTLPTFGSNLKSVILFLQAISWIDLYVTFHVGYYEKNGVLTFHPAKTVVHYLKTNFALDWILVFPFFWVAEAATERESPSFTHNGIGLLKVFQFYKVLQACNYYENDILKRTARLKLLKFLPTVLIVTNMATALLIQIECDIFDPNETIVNDGSTMSIYRSNIIMHCSSNVSSPHDQDEHLNMIHSEAQLYLIGFYWLTASMTSCGFGDMVAHDHNTLLICIFMVLLGVFLYGFMFASIASSKIYAHHNVIYYRAQMSEMMQFLNKEKVEKKMRTRFYKHYMHNWHRTLGHMPQTMLSHIHTALKQDIMDRMYEKTLRKAAIFTFADKSFMRSIVKYIDEIYFLQGEIIVKNKHLEGDLYIIYRGKVDIFGADGKLIASMGGGGVFGNFSEKDFALCSVTAIAATKVELIRLRHEDFRKTLLNYPGISKTIASLSAANPYFIVPSTDSSFTHSEDHDPENPDEEMAQDNSTVSVLSPESDVENGVFYLKRAIYRPSRRLNFVILVDSWLHNIIEFLTVVSSYVSCILVSYVFAFQDFNLYVLVPYFAIDIIFYWKFTMEFHYTYIDSHGDHIYNRTAIKKRYIASKMIYLDLAANFPLEILAAAAKEGMYLPVVSFLRLNRLLRFIYIQQYYNRKIHTLTVNVILLEIATLFANISFMIHFFACIWFIAACPIFFCFEKSWLTALPIEDRDQYEIYISAIYFMVTLVTTTGYGDIVPVSTHEILLTTLIMITSHFAMVLGAVTFLSTSGIQTINFSNYEESMAQVKRDLRRQNISSYQLRKLWSYAQLIWWRECGKQIPQFIYSAPYIMKCDVFMAMFGQHLSKSYIFSNLDETFLRQIAIYMVRYVFFPGNYIVQQGDNDSTMYFIHRGEVSVMTIHLNLMETIHCNLGQNDHFGISQGLTFRTPHEFSYRAETEVEILSLTLTDWQHLFKYFPEVKPIIYKKLENIKVPSQ